ncbi:sarcosine oxidase subunit gamma [Roseivivax isoporae]|uniref:Sarcosine oxidase subunit gamma n=1 Tax=Roseivivax isoporae LMG 25204 TaxID=1449351 RepID=X7F9V7_9RHOB|nr:sarcosine oxidase subunit gamma family protein [Roseivivax isoporae]ETX29560.1 sarcosine oxidase subunit gamma [Roseivivax isoporae LMG 25204]
MFDAPSAQPGARYEGRVVVEDLGPQGMVTLRGDADALSGPVSDVAGIALPDRLSIVADGARRLAWMSPDEFLLFCPYGDAAALSARMAEALSGRHALAVNVSDARASFRLSGEEAALRETLAKLTPADVSPGAFAPGTIRRSRLSQAAAAFWLDADGSLQVICFRSVADYVFALLRNAAHPAGTVGYF